MQELRTEKLLRVSRGGDDLDHTGSESLDGGNVVGEDTHVTRGSSNVTVGLECNNLVKLSPMRSHIRPPLCFCSDSHLLDTLGVVDGLSGSMNKVE